MNDKTKSAKEHYANLFEGVRLVACSSVMLVVCGIQWTAGKIGEFRRKKRKKTATQRHMFPPYIQRIS